MILTVREGLTAFYHRLIRGKLLQQPSFGQPTWSYRLLHLGPIYGLIFAAPALTTMAWYTGLAVASHHRHASAIKSDENLTLELFQLHLHDRLREDYRRLGMPEPASKSELPTYGFFLSNDKFTRLDSMLPPDEGKSNYVDALLQHKNKLYEIEVRYRGTKPWHWNHPQKSWKVRVKGDSLKFDGLPSFNFVNTPDAMPFNEQMVLDTARESGLLTPAYYPFRLLINNAYLGVYFFEGQADEGLLRRERRIPGNIYSGAGAAIDPKTKVSSLWSSSSYWNKVDSIRPSASNDMRELDALLKIVNQGTAREFAAFAQDAIDVGKFATLDAIDVVYGNNQHDYNQNHKIYFDPYKNRFEPIATDFRDMEHERQFNRTENPLLLRLKELPWYVNLRNRKVYELLGSSCNEKAQHERVGHWLKRLKSDQDSDPYWDAYEQLPVMGPYYRQLVRPMNQERQANAAQTRLNELHERAVFLKGEIERQDVQARLYQSSRKPTGASSRQNAKGSRTRSSTTVQAILDITVEGQAGFHWTEVLAETDESCTPLEWQIYADRDLDQTFIDGKDLRLVAVESPMRLGKPDITLFPGVKLEEISVSPTRGRVKAESEPRTYRFFVRAQGCIPEHWRLEGRNAATNANLSLKVDVTQDTPPDDRTNCDEQPGFNEPGQSSPHPFCYPFVSEDTVRLGPGIVEVVEPRVYSANQTVIIEPGTTLRMAEGASIITYGRLLAEGRQDAPIRFVPENKSWGGLALQGPATSGSRLRYVEIERGTRPTSGFFEFPGMVNVHDTNDVQFDHAYLAHNQVSVDALHAAYVQDLSITDSSFFQTFADAIELEFSTAKLERTNIVGAGDNGLTSHGTRVEVRDGSIVQCKGTGVSAGERSDVLLQRDLIARATRGVLLKNASSVNATDVLEYQNQVAIRQEAETGWYPGSSSVSVDGVYAVESKTLLDGLKKPKSGTLKRALGMDDLPQLRQRLVGEGEWIELEVVLKDLQTGSKP